MSSIDIYHLIKLWKFSIHDGQMSFTRDVWLTNVSSELMTRSSLSQPYLLDIDSFKPDIAQPWSKKTWEWIGKGKPPCSDTENDLSYFTDKPAVPTSRHTWTDQQPKNCSFLFLGAIFEWLCDSQLQLNYRFIILKLNSEYLAVEPHSNRIGNKNTEIIIMSNCQL